MMTRRLLVGCLVLGFMVPAAKVQDDYVDIIVHNDVPNWNFCYQLDGQENWLQTGSYTRHWKYTGDNFIIRFRSDAGFERIYHLKGVNVHFYVRRRWHF